MEVQEVEEFVEVADGRLWTVTQGTGRPVALCDGGPGDADSLAPVADMIADIA
jgi:hypothetical protein